MTHTTARKANPVNPGEKLGPAVAHHATRNGWGIGIWKRGGVYAVMRTSDDDRALTLDTARSEREAREIANKHWKLDRGAGPAYIAE